MQTFKTYLTESLVNIDSRDVNLLYKPLESIVKELNAMMKTSDRSYQRSLGHTLYDKYKKYTLKENHWKFSSSQLKTPICKKAHEILPVDIFSGIIQTAMYVPSKKEIFVGVSNNAFNYSCLQLDALPQSQKSMMLSEFTEIRIKSTIQHELVHWIDDAMNNQHMSKRSGDHEQFAKHILGGKSHVGLGTIEVQAQVHQINLIRKRVGQVKWDNMSWDKLLDYHSALRSLDNLLGAEWRKIIKHRMAREGILGKNMVR